MGHACVDSIEVMASLVISSKLGCVPKNRLKRQATMLSGLVGVIR